LGENEANYGIYPSMRGTSGDIPEGLLLTKSALKKSMKIVSMWARQAAV
jgi:hypothetical protein